MIAGSFIKGYFKAMKPEQYLSPQALTVHNQVYELRITTMNVQDELNAVNSLMAMNVPGATVLAAEAKGSTVRLQVQANQFQWAALFAFIPTIIGPIIALIVGIVLLYRIPEWAWAAIPIGIGASIFIYAMFKGKSPKKSSR